MRKRIQVLLAIIASFALAAPVFAVDEGMGTQQQDQPGEQQVQMGAQQDQTGAQQTGQQQDLISSDWLIGKTVYSPKAEELGSISNLIMNQRTGNVGYVTLSTGGFFDFSDQKQIVPFKALEITPEQITLNMTKDKLAEAPQWKEGSTIDEFNRQSSEFFGVSPAWGDDEGLMDNDSDDNLPETEDEGVLENK